jgi:probable HAF family extracellular repeat protein
MQQGGMIDLAPLPGFTSSQAQKVNGAGQVVGSSNTTGDAVVHATLWQP